MGSSTAGVWCCSAGNGRYLYNYRAQLAHISSLPRWAWCFYQSGRYYHAILETGSHNPGDVLLAGSITAGSPGSVSGTTLFTHFQLVPQPAIGHRGKIANYVGFRGISPDNPIKATDNAKNPA